MPVNVYWCRCIVSIIRSKVFFWPSMTQGTGLKNLKNKHCKACEGGVRPLDEGQSLRYLEHVPGWKLTDDKTAITRTLKFKDFLATMSFINAMAYMSERQDHHPDFSAGYNYCEVRYTTHAIGGLSENDYICAAKINELLEP